MEETIAVIGAMGALSREAADRLLTLQNGEAALLYIYLLRNGGAMPEARELGVTAEKLAETVKALRNAGLVQPVRAGGALEQDERPAYSAQHIAGAMRSDDAFAHIVQDTQRRLGKTLSSHDLQLLLGMMDWRGLPPGVLELLIAYCVDEARRKYGEGRPPTVKQIDREARLWEQEGIKTEEEAERYLRRREKRVQRKEQIRRLLQTDTERRLTPTEEKYFSAWAELDMEIIELAYDRTVQRTGGLKLGYMDAILRDWSQKGLTSRRQIEQGDKPPAAQFGDGLDDEERAAIQRQREWESDD